MTEGGWAGKEMRMAPVASKFPGSVGCLPPNPRYPPPPLPKDPMGGRNNTLVPLVPNCTVAQPVTTSVDSVQLIWEGMHGAKGAWIGKENSPQAWVTRSDRTRRGILATAPGGAADEATRKTPNAVCIPPNAAAEGGDGVQAEGGYGRSEAA